MVNTAFAPNKAHKKGGTFVLGRLWQSNMQSNLTDRFIASTDGTPPPGSPRLITRTQPALFAEVRARGIPSWRVSVCPISW